MEAVIEARFASEIAQSVMARFNRSIRREYPLVEETYDISVQLKVGVSGSAPQAVPEQKFTNFKLTDRDGTGLILLGADRLRAYRTPVNQ